MEWNALLFSNQAITQWKRTYVLSEEGTLLAKCSHISPYHLVVASYGKLGFTLRTLLILPALRSSQLPVTTQLTLLSCNQAIHTSNIISCKWVTIVAKAFLLLAQDVSELLSGPVRYHIRWPVGH